MKTGFWLDFARALPGFVLAITSLMPFIGVSADEAASRPPLLPYETGFQGRTLYARPLEGLSDTEKDLAARGSLFFHAAWVPSPSADQPEFQGLGPLFNQLSCIACHAKNGRGAPPSGTEPLRTMVVKLSPAGTDDHEGPLGHPLYGPQFNPRAIPGVRAEGEVHLAWEKEQVIFGDGSVIELRRPVLQWQDLAFGPIGKDMQVSLRNAQPLVGLGLLEAVAEVEILRLAEDQKRAASPVHGQPNWVWDRASMSRRLGRFGQKANQPSLRQQIASAFAEDLGITSTLFPSESCTTAQADCKASMKASMGADPELADKDLDAVTAFIRDMAVPARRDIQNPEVMRGEGLFDTIGCGRCHVETLRLGAAAPVPELSGTDIHPFTDFLLHDMGEGLADGRPDFEASGNQWRTSPLWGLGAMPRTGQNINYLHDSRARTLSEAILWHGGEAMASREHFRTLSSADRQALVTFLNSL